MIGMKRALLFVSAVAAVALAGCAPPEPEGKLDSGTPSTTGQAGEPGAATPATGSASVEGGGNTGVQIHGAGAGGMAPVTGTESLEGSGGGGVNQAAKSAAQNAAASASGGSAAQMGEGEGE